MEMRRSRKPQFTVMAPPNLKYKFSMRGLGISMTGAILLRKMNPRGGPYTANQGKLGETPWRVVRLKERRSCCTEKRRRNVMRKWKEIAGLLRGAWSRV